METVALERSCQIALKEWATVVHAMGRGEQLVLIRKGGLAEAKTGFQLLAQTFVFYPTFEHQAVTYLRASYQHYWDEVIRAKPSEGVVPIELVGKVAFSKETTDPLLVKHLEPFHIYDEPFVTQRLKWQPAQPIIVVAIRAFRLPAPQRLPVVPRYAGCKSWVDLEQPVALENAVPVLDEASFRARLAAIQRLLV